MSDESSALIHVALHATLYAAQQAHGLRHGDHQQ